MNARRRIQKKRNAVSENDVIEISEKQIGEEHFACELSVVNMDRINAAIAREQLRIHELKTIKANLAQNPPEMDPVLGRLEEAISRAKLSLNEKLSLADLRAVRAEFSKLV